MKQERLWDTHALRTSDGWVSGYVLERTAFIRELVWEQLDRWAIEGKGEFTARELWRAVGYHYQQTITTLALARHLGYVRDVRWSVYEISR